MNIMLRAFFAVLFLASLLAVADSSDKANQKARGLMLNAYEIVREADGKLAQSGKTEEVEKLYFLALRRYVAIEKFNPDWYPALINYRIAYCNEKVISLRKSMGMEIKQEPVEELRGEMHGKVTLAKIEELLKMRDIELTEIKNELKAANEKLEMEMMASSKTKEKLAEVDKAWQENASEGFISVRELNKIVAPLIKKIEELKAAYMNAGTEEEKAKVVEEYIAFVQTLSKHLKFVDLHLAGMNIETMLIDVRDSSNPVIYKDGDVKKDPLIPNVKMQKK